uniref:WAP domain-containing protein n=1 Tax=Trichuris muris TaxID=70415 RepID=A0A5S6QPC9_TRIMR
MRNTALLFPLIFVVAFGTNQDPFDHDFPECPVITEKIRQDASKCAEDECPGGQICCQGFCTDPMPPRPKAKEGLCPQVRKIRIVRKNCSHDTECPGKQKCCQQDGTTACTEPKHILTIGFHRKGGHCPPVLSDELCQGAKLCNGDADCFGYDKCCPTDLTFRCLGTQHNPAPPKVGSCKEAVPDKRPYSILGSLCKDDYDCIGTKKCCFHFLADECVNPVM